MAILEPLPPRSRKLVVWLGVIPPEEGVVAFEDRGFQVYKEKLCTDEDLQSTEFLAGLAAVVFSQSPEKPNQIVQHIEMHAQRLLDYDCRIILRPTQKHLGSEKTLLFISLITSVIDRLRLPSVLPDQEAKKLDWQLTGEGELPLPHASVFDTGVPWVDIANFVATRPPGTAPRQYPYLKIDIRGKDGKEISFDGAYPANDPRNTEILEGEKLIRNRNNKLTPGSELLLRRAFWDCKEVHLVAMADGLSGVPVFRAFPELELGQAGHGARGARPYFVKIGDRREIFEEYKNYIQWVRPYIPFHLGPHLVLERCCLGAEQGVIVGDLVDESESLRACASDGRVAHAIACLFNRTLVGWHGRYDEEQNSLLDYKDSRGKEYFPTDIPNDTLARIKELKGQGNLDGLRKLFERSSGLKPILVASIHGDLHGTNVLVRGSDAILIDFLSHYRGPLVYDAANLEAGLLVDGFDNDNREYSDWLDSVLPLYDQDSLFNIHPYIHPKNPSAWFYDCVRQIRLHAHQMERCHGQYAAALAAILLKKSCKNRTFHSETHAYHRAGAYVLAERVLLNHFGSGTINMVRSVDKS